MFCVLFVAFKEQRTHPTTNNFQVSTLEETMMILMSVEIEEYKQLLWQLEPASKENEDDPFEDSSQIQFGTLGQVDVFFETQIFFCMYPFQSWVYLGSNSHICYRFTCYTYFQTFMGCNYILFSRDNIMVLLLLCMKTILFHSCI